MKNELGQEKSGQKNESGENEISTVGRKYKTT